LDGTAAYLDHGAAGDDDGDGLHDAESSSFVTLVCAELVMGWDGRWRDGGCGFYSKCGVLSAHVVAILWPDTLCGSVHHSA
jgi:hypothetical protein